MSHGPSSIFAHSQSLPTEAKLTRRSLQFDISPTGPATKLDMGSCAFETGVTEGKVTNGGANSEISWGTSLFESIAVPFSEQVRFILISIFSTSQKSRDVFPIPIHFLIGHR